MQYYSLVPAYGRDYKTAKAVKEDWNANKDFRVESFNGSGYINKEQAEKDMPGAVLNIRYKQLTEVCSIKVKGP